MIDALIYLGFFGFMIYLFLFKSGLWDKIKKYLK